MTAKLGVDGTVPSPELLHDAARNFEHGGVSVAGNGLHGEAENVKDGNEAGADSGGRIPERDTSGEVQYIQAPSDLARWNLRGSRLRSPKLDIQLQFSDQDEDRGGDTEDDLADRDVAKAELGPAPQQAVSEGWESFLPQRHLRVLLVEDDDSTRHVVAALLRNCCYEGNGLQAWELLEGPNNHFDLVLTDVVMPCLSGVGLLSRIMSREAGKQIPVVMMSSHDSMDIVFKCLSKGAADYLVKPVRKNELKNLWQHVWRKCHSSSGSGSGSASQTGEVMRSKRRAGSGNNSGSNDGSDNGSSGLNLRGGSDNGSGTQSSWTRRAVEVESPQQAPGRDVPGPSSGVLPKTEPSPLQTRVEELKGLRPAKMKEVHIAPQDKVPEADVLNDTEPSAGRSPAAGLEDVVLDHKSDTGKTLLDLEAIQTCEEQTDNNKNRSMSILTPSDERFPEAIDLTAAIASQQLQGAIDNPDDIGEGKDNVEGGAFHSSATKNNTDSSSLPILELSLKRSRTAGDVDAAADDRCILRQSGGSAFSRYSTSGANMSQQFVSGSCHLHGYPLSTGFGGHSLAPGGPGGTNAGLLQRGPNDRPGSSRGSGDVSAPLLVHPSLSNNGNGQDMSSSVVGPSGRDMLAGPRPVMDEAVSLTPLSGQQVSLSVPLPSSGMLSYDSMSAAFGASIHQVFYSHTGPAPWTTSSGQVADREVYDNTFHDHGQLPHPQAQRHLHHQGLHRHHDHDHPQQQNHPHHHHHHHTSLPQAPVVQQEDSVLACAAASIAARCGSSNVAGNIVDGCNGQSGSSNCHGSNNNGNGHGNGSANGSASGSNNFSKGNNGHSNGQSVAHVAVAGNGDSGNASGHGDCGMNNTYHGTSGNGSGSGNVGNGGVFVTGPEATKFSRREAALNKFRQKRKERCFEKKVRYQSRKRLAEQRPRIRGQFVRQAVYDGGAGEADQ